LNGFNVSGTTEQSTLPNLIIAGVHKAATTSLFTYLSWHPDISPSSKKELHFFSPIIDNQPIGSINDYAQYFKDGKTKYRLEASPSYIYGKERIIKAMMQVLGDHRVVIILRDPVKRYVSFYNHLKSKLLIPSNISFGEFFEKSVKVYQKKAFLPKERVFYRALNEGFYIDYLEYWFQQYAEKLRIVFFEDLVRSPKTELLALSKWLQIDESIYQGIEDYSVENKTIFSRNIFLHKCALQLNMHFEPFFRKNYRLKRIIRRLYFMINTNKRRFEEIDEDIILKLGAIYRDSNAQLADYLLKNNYKSLPTWLTEQP